MTQTPCPYCSNPNYLEAFTKGRVKEIDVQLPIWARQGKFWRQDRPKGIDRPVTAPAKKSGNLLLMLLEGDLFEERWRDFTVEVFGYDSSDSQPPGRGDDEPVYHGPPGPFLFFAYAAEIPGEYDRGTRFRMFDACRITNRNSDITLFAHWHPSHGRLIKIEGVLNREDPNADIEAFKTAFDFFQRETRGAPKITENDLVKAMQTLGEDATLTSVAKELEVTRQALQFWARRGGMESWEKVKERYSTALVR